MKTCIYYASRNGNTRDVAEAMADALRPRGPVRIHTLEDDTPAIPEDADLVIVGGPTEGRHATPAVTAFLDGVEPQALRGRAVAAFDTRLDWPRWLFGSAAADIVERLLARGARPVASPESFFVTTRPELKPGERERAAEWAASIATNSSNALAGAAG